MAIYKIHKTKDYTIMSNFHLRDSEISLKAKGLLSLMFSLPDDWNYSVRGLESICKESKDTINGIINELEHNNYIERKRIYCNGKISEWEYNIYETNDLHPKKQDIENQDIENKDIYKELNNKELNNQLKRNILKKKPTLEEIQNYINEENLNVDAQVFYDYYESNGWKVGRNTMKDFKATLRNWSRKQFIKKNNKPEWINKEIHKEEINNIELEELENEFKQFR